MDTFYLYSRFQIVDEITISPLIRKVKKSGASRASLLFADFDVAK